MKTNINPLPLPLGIPLALQFLQQEIVALRQKAWCIAIDGYSSSGKSTIAKQLAAILNYMHVDSGAMYRALTLQFIRHDIPLDDDNSIKEVLNRTQIRFTNLDGKQVTILNDENVESKIRTMQVSNLVSPVAAISAVRKFLVREQRAMAGDHGIVMDGRDIGTVVFPYADIKLFVTADLSVRTRRRYRELEQKGIETSIEEVSLNLSERDRIDTTRKDSPLTQAIDAVLLNTSDLSESQQLQKALEIIFQKVQA